METSSLAGVEIWRAAAALPNAAISGDGETLVAFSDDVAEIRRAGSTRRIASTAIKFGRIDVYRDGTKFVGTNSRGASLVDGESGSTEWISPGDVQRVTFSSDGSRVLFQTGGHDWIVYDATMSSERVRAALGSAVGQSIPLALGESVRRFLA